MTEETPQRKYWVYVLEITPKMLRETLCVAQTQISNSVMDTNSKQHHLDRLDMLIKECDDYRPLGFDGTHGDLHTMNCGCEDKPVIQEGDDWTITMKARRDI